MKSDSERTGEAAVAGAAPCSVIPCAAARQWMLDNADAQESFAKTAASRKDMEEYKLRRDCAWAFRYVAEKAQDAEAASSPNSVVSANSVEVLTPETARKDKFNQ